MTGNAAGVGSGRRMGPFSSKSGRSIDQGRVTVATVLSGDMSA